MSTKDAATPTSREKPASPSAPSKNPAKTLASVPLPAIVIVLIFSSLSAIAWAIIWTPVRNQSPDATLTLMTFCPPKGPPARYALVPAWLGGWTVLANDALCQLTTFFSLIIHSPWPEISPGTAPGGGGRELTWELVVTIIPVLGVLFLEAERPSASVWIRYPVFWGLLYQNIAGATIFPICYMLLFVTSPPRLPIPSHRGEAVFVGIIIGYGIPTLGMLFFQDDRWALLWQFFPLTVPVARDVWATIRPAAKGPDPELGDFWARMAQGLGVVLGTVVHVLALLEAAPLDGGYNRMWTAYARTFLPVLPLPNPLQDPQGHLWHSLANFLKWNWIFIWLSTWVAALIAVVQTRTARARKEFQELGTWALMAAAFVLMGPAASFHVPPATLSSLIPKFLTDARNQLSHPDLHVARKWNLLARACNLLTGEEQRWVGERASHLACTVEMTPCGTELDVVVLDEIQLLADPDRGSSWMQVLLGANAQEVHVCGEDTAVGLVQRIAEECGTSSR
ncbi:hypothetical protein DACRYDRAFT_104362 [Dacryopinax primogenitus]|uniref:ATP-dependent RNA helicase SUV3 DEXQ-box helicase domain-containing protein n=1 Tax=Dacryopinax primogenitus (strain DJM 731) TaxID=1858805 RepID=M5GGQ0_DACPD|nr:uncharacterized protein DACRYDRAFT_104362 [Dacryopinax primogenitus]EJU05873.1 hypothetical protein DACRYDRAFT_104362 [Dacryopinax primogenitus]